MFGRKQSVADGREAAAEIIRQGGDLDVSEGTLYNMAESIGTPDPDAFVRAADKALVDQMAEEVGSSTERAVLKVARFFGL